MINITFLKKKLELCELINRLEERSGVEFDIDSGSKYCCYVDFGKSNLFIAQLNEDFRKIFIFDINSFYNFKELIINDSDPSFEETLNNIIRYRVSVIKDHLERVKEADRKVAEAEKERLNKLKAEMVSLNSLKTKLNIEIEDNGSIPIVRVISDGVLLNVLELTDLSMNQDSINIKGIDKFEDYKKQLQEDQKK